MPFFAMGHCDLGATEAGARCHSRGSAERQTHAALRSDRPLRSAPDSSDTSPHRSLHTGGSFERYKGAVAPLDTGAALVHASTWKRQRSAAPARPPPAPHNRSAAHCQVRLAWAPCRWCERHGCSLERQRTPAQPPRLFGDALGEGGGAPLAAGGPPAGRPHRHTIACLLHWRPCGEDRRRRLSWPASVTPDGGGQASRCGSSWPAEVRQAYLTGDAAEGCTQLSMAADARSVAAPECPPCCHTQPIRGCTPPPQCVSRR